MQGRVVELSAAVPPVKPPSQPSYTHPCMLCIAVAVYYDGATHGNLYCVTRMQGNGTAAIFARDPQVTTVSMHGARNYPWSSRHPSTLDVDVPDGAGDEEYLRLLQETLARVDTLIGWRPEDRSHQTDGSSAPRIPVLASVPSDLLVFYQAGVDPLMHDRLGRLKLTRTGLRDRNAAVLRWCEERSLPLVVTMGGGYSRPIELSARCHADVFIQAAGSFVRRAESFARDSGDSEQLAVGCSTT